MTCEEILLNIINNEASIFFNEVVNCFRTSVTSDGQTDRFLSWTFPLSSFDSTILLMIHPCILIINWLHLVINFTRTESLCVLLPTPIRPQPLMPLCRVITSGVFPACFQYCTIHAIISACRVVTYKYVPEWITGLLQVRLVMELPSLSLPIKAPCL